ncbi:hypothetical protein ACSSS7_004063 [Eimeria intestinalis]
MPLEDLYCVAYAPVQGTCLMDLGDDDYTLETLQKELRYLENLTSTSLQAFSKFFETADPATAEGAAALYCLSSFFNRLQVVSLRAGTLAGEILNLNKVDYHDALKKITAKVKAGGLQPEDSRLEDLYETDQDADWEVPAAGKGKVEFRHAVSMVPHAEDGGSDVGEVTHQPVKAEFTRKKVRKATGYAKFNFNDADATDSEVIRRSSSVSMGAVQEIQDKDADANWHDSERQSGRFARIRGRIPTGHASLMKSSSDDMLDVLLAEDTEEGRRARELLLHNTQLNSCSPPLSPPSSDYEAAPSGGAATRALDSSEVEDDEDGDRTFTKRDSTERDVTDSSGVLSILECQLSACR